MTCVVGISDPGRGALLAFDSCGGAGGRATPRLDTKGSLIRPWLAVGYTTSYRFGQILTHHLDIQEEPPGDPYEWAVRTLVPEIQAKLSEHQWLKKDGERAEAGDAIFAVRDRILCVQSDLQVSESARGYDACGSGQDEALGALFARRFGRAEERARVALEAAAEMTVYVRPPWHFLRTAA